MNAVAKVDHSIELILVRCPWHNEPLGKVEAGAAYELHCRKCKDYRTGIAK